MNKSWFLPRRSAYILNGAIVVVTGLAVGGLAAHMSDESAQQTAADVPAAVVDAADVPEPVVVTKVRVKHVKSKPVIVYKHVPASGSSGGSSSSSSSGGSSAGSGSGAYTGGGSGSVGSGSSGTSSGTQAAPAPRPAPVQAPPQTTSHAS